MRILSWNIQWGLGIDGKADLVRTAAVAREFDADVLCLQEVAVNHPDLPGLPRGAPLNQSEWLAGLFLGYEAIYGIGSDLPGENGGPGGRRQFGNLILSRRPVLQVFRHLLPWPADPAVPSMPRVAVEAVIDAPGFPGGALRVITTHLEYYSAIQRTAQIEALRGICDNGWQHAVTPRSATETDPPFAVLPRGEGCVLCGDFNSPAGAPEHAPLQWASEAPAFVNAWEQAHPAVPPAPTFGVHDRRYIAEPACYDFFFVSENIAGRVADVHVDGGTTASDHQPVLLDIA
ncbi:MAG: endonuclease/exonuclease/phosphatase family protein [Rhodocyclaceae bacterium]|nr:endonuclease/exonuclease/phosphatase family protein [Rhodocyclaceae bacterium]MDZ4215351.1 endonuclease/exonuclease/phosphatase family protein [Rhodocyclaceae bacterium]